MNADEKKALMAAMVASQHGPLQRYLKSRLRHAMADVPDLVQEIFLRLLRVNRPDAIRSPEAYLFTVAKHVLHQHKMRQSAAPEAIDIMSALEELEERPATGPEAQLEAQQRLDEVSAALAQLPRKAYVTVLLNRVAGMPLEEVGARLGISRPMAKKYLARALAHCRERDREGE